MREHSPFLSRSIEFSSMMPFYCFFVAWMTSITIVELTGQISPELASILRGSWRRLDSRFPRHPQSGKRNQLFRVEESGLGNMTVILSSSLLRLKVPLQWFNRLSYLRSKLSLSFHLVVLSIRTKSQWHSSKP